MSAQLRLIKPSHKNRSVLARPPNAELRTREYLTPAEVEKLMKEARQGRYGHRDATLILAAFRHGLRASEICDLEWSQVEFGRSASLHVRGSRTASRVSTRCAATKSEHCASCAGNFPIAVMCLRPDGEGRSRRRREPPDQAYWRTRRLRLPDTHPHAAPRLRLRACEQRPRYPCHPGLAGPSFNPTHCPLHGVVANAV